jgi:hypothetical protein
MKKKDRKSPFADTSFNELEESLANASPGGAAGYHRERARSRWVWVVGFISLTMLGLIPLEPSVGIPVAATSLAAAVLSLVLSLSARSYSGVRSQVKSVRGALRRAEAMDTMAASESWGYNLGQLGVVLEKTAREISSERAAVERKIGAADQRRSAKLKKLLQEVMAAGTLVEREMRRADPGFSNTTWQSPLRWPGESNRRMFPANSLFGRVPLHSEMFAGATTAPRHRQAAMV